MAFTQMTKEQYRSLDSDALELRRAEVIAAAENGEIETEELRSESALIKDEMERRRSIAQLRSAKAAEVAAGAGRIIEGAQGAQERSAIAEDDEPKNGVEYRRAFMDYVMRGVKSEKLAQYRENANTKTTDVGVVIPPMLVEKILEKAETYGMILPLVTKTNYPSGVEIPKGSMKPVATWVNEGATSDKQKFGLSDKVTFTHHKLRCEVSISMEVSTMALDVFEKKLVESVARAMVVAKENAIINGTGNGSPKGILTETPAEGQALEVASGKGLSYELLCDAEAAIPQAYETGAKWFMSKKTFMAFAAMTDTAGQPIARVNYGIGGSPERFLLGREVVLTGDYLPNFAKAPSADTTFAFIFAPEDYVLNSIYDMGLSKRQDWETEDIQTKAVTACDGKVIDVNSLVTLTVTKAAA